MPDLAELIGRVEKAECGRRFLDLDIAAALGADTWDRHGRLGPVYRCVPWLSYNTSRWMSIPQYTSHLEDALALVEAKLPIQQWSVRTFADSYEALVGIDGHSFIEAAPTPALALVLALLRALQAKEDGR